ncbi:enhanced serine sensitivity protein SseB C-terminal domain-containing protein [Flavobacterium sp.]|uniref:enhanced serine sensitivity protein SseB C-terminal domain-containing protein n=1 Tax=Flavobacterium sp. TaxID=239 RepID=UPI0039E53DD9
MSFFDFFKKKPETQPSEPLSLEALLQKAATEPAFRAEFSKRLPNEQLIIITEGSDRQGEHTLEADTTVNILSLNDGRLPVFTSNDRIFDQNVIKEEVHMVQIKASDLFVMTKGATLVINPFSQCGKDLLPHEIEQMLDGGLRTSKKITIEKETQVQIGQPAKYPDALIASLQKLFAERPNVSKAYIGWLYNPKSSDPPHYLFSIEVNGDFQSLFDEVGFTAEEYLEPKEVIDIVRFGVGTLDDYFESTEPFYKR